MSEFTWYRTVADACRHLAHVSGARSLLDPVCVPPPTSGRWRGPLAVEVDRYLKCVAQIVQ